MNVSPTTNDFNNGSMSDNMLAFTNASTEESLVETVSSYVTNTSSNRQSAINTLEQYAVPSLYFVLFLFGIIGNSVVLYVSCFLTRKSKNAVDVFVGNLALADLALITCLPFWAVTHSKFSEWIFGNAGCKIVSLLTHLNMHSSIFFITAMAVDRYTVVVKAVKVRAKSLRSVKRSLISCTIIWSFALFLSLPAVLLREQSEFRGRTVCRWIYPKETQELWWVFHMISRNIIAFVIPLSIICRCYCVIVSYVRSRSRAMLRTAKESKLSVVKKENSRDKQQEHVTRLVTVIILAFVICWLPNQLSNFSHGLIHFGILPEPSTEDVKNAMYLIHLFTTALSFCNSVINPILYSTSPSHRMHIKTLMMRVCICCKQKLNKRAILKQDPFSRPINFDHKTNQERNTPRNECHQPPKPGQLDAIGARHKASFFSDCTANTMLSATNGNYTRYSQSSLLFPIQTSPRRDIVINRSLLPTGVEPITAVRNPNAPTIVVDIADDQQRYLLVTPSGNKDGERQESTATEPNEYYQTISTGKMMDIEDIDKEEDDGDLLMSKYTSSQC